ncbi:uncharacterized protein LOC130630716 isoform X2 [Hydractinia symbiolongicarpus]|uniref:uncharacterized protein LOC130630716 isoform X2 n=1 Tax=Hydractinia symbiolongicarpus TaxID=13093 RepID=UPI00254C044F|nr:uncharacterized protein LOC130630716 isoform X2 [Hydractinia symbiolongicarpus]
MHIQQNWMLRKRKCGQLPEIILMKSKFSKQPKKDAAHEIEGAIRSSNVWGVKNHLPACDPGEDDRTMEMHRRTLVKQYNVHHYNRKMSVLQVAMNKTFSWRRKLIIEDGCVAELFDKFPLLKEPRQIIDEFKRLTELDVDLCFQQHLSKNAAKIIRLQPPKLHIDPNLMETISCEATCDEKYQMSMVLLPHLLREDASNLFQNFGKKTFVQICATGHVPTLSDVFRTGATYRVVIDGNETDATDSLIMAFEVVFALHYLFNLAYPTCLEAFFSFIQKHIIKLKDGTAPNSKALKLISKLNEI